jgi:hypothetical protein
MNTKIVLALGVALLVAAAAWSGRETIASGQDGAKADRGQNADALKQAKTVYAQAVLKVARADLNKAREANSRVPETIPRSILRALENDVAVGTARLQGLLGGTQGGENPYMMAAKESLKFAEENLQQATNANARAAGAVGAAEVERRQADVELAKAKLEVAKLLDGVDPLEITRWELLQLQEDVHDLRSRMRLLQYRN